MASRFHILLASATVCGFTFAQKTSPPGDANQNARRPSMTASAANEWKKLRTKAEAAFRDGHFKEAELHLLDAIRIAEQEGLNDDRLASVLANLGWLRVQQGQAVNGEQLLQHAASLYRGCGGDCTMATARTLRHLGATLRLQGRFTSAEQALREGLSRIRSMSDAAAERAQLLNELGWVHLHRNQPHLAADHFRRGIKELEEARSDRDFLPQLYQSLSTAHILADKHTEAEQACHRALELVDSKTPPQVAAAIYLRLGNISAELGRYEPAERHLKLALDLFSNTPGTSPFDLWPVYYEMANMELLRGNYARAEARFVQALGLAETVINPSHPEFLKLRANYAVLLRKQNRNKEAARIEAELRATWSRRNARETDSETVDARDLKSAGKHRGR